jgi:hypothetical protein
MSTDSIDHFDLDGRKITRRHYLDRLEFARAPDFAP